MPGTLPPGVKSGSIFLHPQFYLDRSTGELKPKFLIVLAPQAGNDVVFRLLTSQQTGRSENPPCHHGNPYPGFFLGVLGPPLGKKSWIDLRPGDDYEEDAFLRDQAAGLLTPILELDGDQLRAAMECAAAADDTTVAQERAIRDALARLP